MTPSNLRLLVLLFLVTALPRFSAGAHSPGTTPRQTAAQQQTAVPQQTATPQQGAKPPDNAGAQIDVEKIRQLLLKPPGPFSMPPPVPLGTAQVTLRQGVPYLEDSVSVFGRRWRLATMEEQVEEVMRQGPWQDVPQVYAVERGIAEAVSHVQFLHPVNAVLAAHGAIAKASYRRKVTKARREVEEELRALETLNKAAETTPPKRQP